MLERHRIASLLEKLVGLFKSDEEKEAARERRAQKRAAARERRARETFARSPVGQATAAHERGDAILQVAMPVDEDSSQVLAQIEAVGWKLEHAGYAFIVSGDSDDIGGELTGVYLFRPAPGSTIRSAASPDSETLGTSPGDGPGD